VTDAIDKLIERLRNPKLNEDMCSIPLRYEAVEALRSQQVEIGQLRKLCEYLDIPFFLRQPGAVEADVKREFEKLQAEIKRQDAVIARLGEDKMFAIGYSCATELLTRIEYARANRKPESNNG